MILLVPPNKVLSQVRGAGLDEEPLILVEVLDRSRRNRDTLGEPAAATPAGGADASGLDVRTGWRPSDR